MQGRRKTMEDAHRVMTDVRPGIHVFATFDGHRGAEVAIFAAQQMPILMETCDLAQNDFQHILRGTFHAIDGLLGDVRYRQGLLDNSNLNAMVPPGVQGALRAQEMERLVDEEGWYAGLAGCTALVALLDVTQKRLVVANAGDSRAVLCRSGHALALSTDHKPSNDSERMRIEAAGSLVAGGRLSTPHSVGGILSVSRGLGSLEHKLKRLQPEVQAVTAEPELREVVFAETDEFVLLACDGVWDVMTSEEAVHIVRMKLAAGASLNECAEALLKESFDLGSTDNLTALLFRVNANTVAGGETVASRIDHDEYARSRRLPTGGTEQPVYEECAYTTRNRNRKV